ncbi:uncharacterized protein LOC106369034 [Brassica napus]|uniref:uncharacterized protein LOC106369034 n=1 Tax=Brassica napus TaxID=3708 RepID=UPI002078882B|nr:uncharacterized protein LOC106369034 [Brassica napus]
MKFDVFLSFRGIDTRRTFVSHLLLALFKKQFKTFRQEEEMPWNQPASTQVLEAIENSKIAIVVISKNYTASVSCLDELAKIVECEEKQSLVMIPVLHEVDPSDVLEQAQNLDGDSNNNWETVERWRKALASMIKTYQQLYSHWEDGDSSEDGDTDAFIIFRVMLHVSKRLKPPEKMVETMIYHCHWMIPEKTGFLTKGIMLVRDVFRKIAGRIMYAEKLISVVNPSTPARSPAYVQKDKYVTGNELSQLAPSIDFDSLVGMDRQMKAVDALLLNMDSEEDGLGEMGICGEERVGKTTLARCVYQKVSPQFQDHYYFEYQTAHSFGSTCLLEKIARAGLSAKVAVRPGEELERFDELVNANLGHRKVLLIVDIHLYDTGQLENIRNIARRFGPGSRLIYVTQSNRVLLKCGVKHLYKVETLRYDEALQLFSQFAFKQEHVPREYFRLSIRAVLITGRIPLTLKVFGSFLRGKTVSEWESELCRLEASQDNCVAKIVHRCFMVTTYEFLKPLSSHDRQALRRIRK